jgi:CDP-diglyceride synthetase
MGEHGGFFAGSMFGSTRIVPHLSPNKSLEGFIGNMAASSLISIALRRFFVDALPIPSDLTFGDADVGPCEEGFRIADAMRKTNTHIRTCTKLSPPDVDTYLAPF